MMTYHNLVARHDPWPTGAARFHRYAFHAGMEVSVHAAIVLVILLFDAWHQAAERAIGEARLQQNLAGAPLASTRERLLS